MDLDVRIDSPELSCVSVKSNHSMGEPLTFKEGAENRVQQEKQDVPVSSCDQSMYEPLTFKDGALFTEKRVQQERTDVPSCLSMKSDHSKDELLTFKDGTFSTKQRVQQESPDSYVSMRSHQSMYEPLTFTDGALFTEKSVQQERPDLPVPSCVSMKSDQSMCEPLTFKDGSQSTEKRDSSDVATGHANKGHNEADQASIFMLLEENIFTFVKTELKKFQDVLRADYPECLQEQKKDDEEVDGEEEKRRNSSREALLKIALDFLRSMKQEEMADFLQSRTLDAVCQNKLKNNLKETFQCLYEGIAKAGNPTPLNDVYTELYITEGGSGEVNDEHEIRQIETASRKQSRPESVIKCEDIFQPSPDKDHRPIRTVLTKGMAGIGKTVLTHKFSLDWAEHKTNRNIQFMFPFTFRELNLLSAKKYSLTDLLHLFFTETRETEICRFDQFQVVFIFDGLDECRLPLDFHNNEILTDVTEASTVDVLLTNLIRGKLLPSARLWITTRPAAANQIPPEFVDVVTEVRGFTDTQKKEYFKKRFREEEQTDKIISHVKKSRSLHIMCHIPVFCWITASVLDHVLRADERGELPKTLTQMYIHFLMVQSKIGNVKFRGASETDPIWNPETRKMILSLGKLAFEQLQKGNLIFYESDLIECGIDIRAASVYSGVFTEIFKEECGLHQDKVFCFVHLSFQEFLAALYVFVTFVNSGVNLLSESQSMSCWSPLLREKSKINLLYQSAVDKIIESSNGHLDLFLRFLLGFSLETNKTLLKGLLTQSGGSLQSYQETVRYIKKKIRRNPSPERCINLFHCLNELNDHSLVEEIQQYLSSGSLSTNKLSPAQWSALVFILLSSEKDLDVFDLREYSASEEGLLRLLQVVKASRICLLSDCKLTERSCEALARVLISKSSRLRELDLSNNDLQDSGVKELFAGQRSSHSGLETLRLSGCNLSEKSCEALASVLSSPSSSLKGLDLSNNDLQDSGVKLLATGLASPHCRLETLRLSGCLITEEGCAALVAALTSNPSYLRELDLSYNHPGESGVRLLSAGLDDPQWRLDTLCVDHGGRHHLKPFKYACELTLDPNTANTKLSLSEHNRKVTAVTEEQPYPEHPDRFNHWKQVLCSEGLTGRCYWEVEWKGWVNIGVTYRGMKRKGQDDDSCLGENNQSWGLFCSGNGYSACHNRRTTDTRAPSSFDSGRVAVYLDWPAGSVSFYRVSSDTLIHLHTFNTTFKEPLYPAFRFRLTSASGASASLCQSEEEESPPA